MLEAEKMDDRNFNAQIARDILSKPENYIILDTEKTGLYPAEIVELAIIDLEGKTLFNRRIKPKFKVTAGAAAIHGITNKALENEATFYQLYPEISSIMTDKEILIYNAAFDIPILEYCCNLDNLKFPDCSSFCIMQIYSEWFGEWSDYHKSYKWQKLPGGDHSALGDCLATLKILKKMATTPPGGDDTAIADMDLEIPY